MKRTYKVWGSWMEPESAATIEARSPAQAAEFWMMDHQRDRPHCHWITQDVACCLADSPSDVFVFRVKYRVEITADAEEIAGPVGPIESALWPEESILKEMDQ